MKKKTLYLTEQEEDLKVAAEILRQGGTVIFPTETVYGLGGNAWDFQAAEKIFTAKGRPSDNPLIVHIAEEAMLLELVQEIPEKAQILMEKFWPGPLTLIFQKSQRVPKEVTGGLDTVAVRMPAHPVAKKLLEIAKIPVAAPSANRSGFPSPTNFSHVKADMDGRVDAIVQGADCAVGVESTVLDLSGITPILYRPGAVTLEQIEESVGKVEVITKAKKDETPKSPGLKYRHYAPKARVEILHGNLDQVEEYVKKSCDKEKTGMLVFDEFPMFDERLVRFSLGSKNDADSAAHQLFAGLRSLDEQGVSLILAPEIPDRGVWNAVKNRLYRAAGETLVDLDKKATKILFVCTGNTCRSPMAEGLLSAKITSRENVSSAGIFADGTSVSQNSVLVMQEKNIDISSHISRQVTKEMIDEFDLVLTMTASHKQMLQAAFPKEKGKILTLGEWAGETEDVKDPYGGSIEDYRECMKQIARFVEKGCRNNL